MKIVIISAIKNIYIRSIILSTMLIMIFMCGCGDDGFKDAINNETGDAPPSPGNSGIVAASYISPTSLDIRWQDAGDDLTSPPNLRYRVFVSMSAFSSVQEAERTGVELTGGWTLGISSLRAEISSGIVYSWCNVFVSDENGNISAYGGVIPSLYANTPPDTDGSSLAVVSSVPLKATVSWTKASDLQSPQTSLRYRAFFSASPSNVNTFAHAEAGGTEVTSGWTGDIDTIEVNLPAGGTWWFNVFVMDGGGLVSGYVQKNVIVADRTPPEVDDPVVRLSAGASAVEISWTKADDTDGETVRDLLQYRICCSTVRSVLENDLPPPADAAIGVSRGWITFDPSNDNSLYFTANGLASGTVYYFRVYVRDLDLMISPYGIAQCTTVAGAYPVPGGGGLICAVPKAAKKIELSWSAAADDLTAPEDLLYSVFSSEITSTNNAYDDVSTYEAAIGAVRNSSTTVRLETMSNNASDTGWVRNITALSAKMDKSTSYYFAVFVKDADGNISAYMPVKQTTN
ncbi:MAG TPA: fibronectin type III domain-containing protein [Spirochaetota bacterium]|nr:fibronectin type III domain-containing protein [Spirochaetota bacterium]